MSTHETTEKTRANRSRVQRYRAKNPRIDYAPSKEALAVIKAWRLKNLHNCTVGVIDRLILAGHKAMSGNLIGKVSGNVSENPPTK